MYLQIFLCTLRPQTGKNNMMPEDDKVSIAVGCLLLRENSDPRLLQLSIGWNRQLIGWDCLPLLSTRDITEVCFIMCTSWKQGHLFQTTIWFRQSSTGSKTKFYANYLIKHNIGSFFEIRGHNLYTNLMLRQVSPSSYNCVGVYMPTPQLTTVSADAVHAPSTQLSAQWY